MLFLLRIAWRYLTDNCKISVPNYLPVNTGPNKIYPLKKCSCVVRLVFYAHGKNPKVRGVKAIRKTTKETEKMNINRGEPL